MIREIRPDKGRLIIFDEKATSIFLAGTIDNGNSKNWQKELIEKLNSHNLDLIVYNPRRDNWGEGYSIENQIRWELNRLEESDEIIMVILPDSKSPISLLEFGLFARKGNLHVFCDPEFYRFDNVRITSEVYGIDLHETTDMSEIIKTVIRCQRK